MEGVTDTGNGVDMEISLANCQWQIKGYWPYVPIKETSMELGQVLKGTTNWIEAKVPGGVHYDLYKAGYIENPYYGQNSLKCEWVENRWWMYRTTFPMPKCTEEKVFLYFEGLDYEVMIYLNDSLVAEHQGMYEPVKVEVTSLLKEENKLVLIFKGVPDEMGQIGYTSRTSTQKSRFNYKWDFSTHLVNIGIWKDVKLIVEEDLVFENPYVISSYNNGKGTIKVEGEIKGKPEYLADGPLVLELKAPNPEKIYTKELCITKDGKAVAELEIENPQLWYPNGYGKQPLYQLEIKKRNQKEDKLLYQQKIGIRSIELIHNENEHKGALPYTFTVNNQRIYIKGVNITPLDHVYGNVSKEQYEHLVEVCVRANVNLIRVWGGGLIEKEWLYEYCDQAGILIWQEFIQSSSGIDNKPCEEKAFLELLERNSKAAILGKRNYTSLAVWSGGNELTEEGNHPCDYENTNIALLKGLVETYDRERFFYPTSASGPEEFVSFERGVSHDVHGGWRYEGNPIHYEKYGTSDHLFHSEFGTDGTPSFKTLQKFLPPKDWYPTPMSENLTWQHHGEWWGTYFRDVEMFGEIKEIEEFVKLSQFMQVEGLKFMIEADRRRKYQSSGSIVWQLNEPWPNASCTNLLDYYGELKPAYYAVKKAFAPLHVSMDYRKLHIQNEEELTFPIYVHNSLEETEIFVRGKAFNRKGEVLYTKEYEGKVLKDSSTKVAEWTEKWVFEDILYIALELYQNKEFIEENLYTFGHTQPPVLKGIRGLKGQIECSVKGTEQEENNTYIQTLSLKNIGSEVALQVGVELDRDDWLMIADDNYFSLLPNQEKEMKIQIYPRKNGGFLEEYNYNENSEHPKPRVHWI